MSENEFEDYLKDKAGNYEVPPHQELFDRIYAQSQSSGKFEKNLAAVAAGYRVHPDSSVWNNISRALGHTSSRRWMAWGIAASLVIGTGLGLYWTNTGETAVPVAEQKQETSVEEPAKTQAKTAPAPENSFPGIENTGSGQEIRKSGSVSIENNQASGQAVSRTSGKPSSPAQPNTQATNAKNPEKIQPVPSIVWNENSPLLNPGQYEPMPLYDILPFRLVVTTPTPETPQTPQKVDDINPNAQPGNANKEKPKVLNWDIAAYYTPQFGNWHLYGNKYESSSSYVQARNQNDRTEYCYAAGLELGRRVGEHLRFFGGLQYQYFTSKELTLSNGVETKALSTVKDPGVLSLDPNMAAPNYVKNTYQFLQVPLGIEWLIRTKNQRWIFGAGLKGGAQYLLYSKSFVFKKATNSYSVMDGKNNVDIHDLNFTAGARIISQYNVTRSIGIFLVPEFNYALRSNFSDNYIVNAHPYTIGVQSGIRINF